MQYLIEKNQIGPEELRAAEEIARVYGYLTEGMFKTQNFEWSDKSYSGNDPSWFGPAWGRYKDWGKRIPKHSVDITLAIVWDRESAGAVDRRLSKRNGFAKFHLIFSLRAYALQAGWATGRLAEEWSRELSYQEQTA